ncbi:MAG: hypothetical protein J7501_12300 [Bdellovibrio sp.]|nr:hypothetical protein [Bdellovibrio sp.]
MNHKFILYNFEEIQEEIETLMKKLKRGDISHAELYSGVQHVYHHLNIAWNARDTEPGKIADLDDPMMDVWNQFPTDIKLI